MSSKLDKIGYHHNETGEIFEDMTLDDIKFIKYQEEKARKQFLLSKFEKDLDNMNLEEVEELKKIVTKNKKTVNLKLTHEDCKFIKILRKHEDIIMELDNEVVGVITKCSLLANRDGVLRYRNGRLIKSFSKLRNFLEVTDYKWRSIYKVLKEKEIIGEGVVEGSSFLVINPLYSSSHNTVDSYKFIAFHKSLKEYLEPIDYHYLMKKLEIEC